MGKAYIILEVGWEYDDEYYYTGNYGDATYEAPKEIFLDVVKAKEEWLKREIKSFRQNEIIDYVGREDESYYVGSNYSLDDILSYAVAHFGFEESSEDLWDLKITDKHSDELVADFIKMFKFRFHHLNEVEITE